MKLVCSNCGSVFERDAEFSLFGYRHCPPCDFAMFAAMGTGKDWVEPDFLVGVSKSKSKENRMNGLADALQRYWAEQKEEEGHVKEFECPDCMALFKVRSKSQLLPDDLELIFIEHRC